MTENIRDIYDKIYRYSFYKIRNSAAAEDITQETFLKYFEQNKRLRRGEEMAYLYTIAKNLCVDYFRKKPIGELREGECPAEEFAAVSDTKIAVREALGKIDGRQREILLLRYIGGLSVNETAKAAGLSRFAVYRLERGGLAEMRKYLGGG